MPCRRLRLVRFADDILLDLHELVDAQQPAHVLARAARLAAEAGRIAGVEDRQLVAFDDLARMERGQSDFGGPRQPQFVVRELVRFLAMAGELALVEEGLLARDRRHGDRGEAGLGDLLQRPAHQLGLEQRQPPFEAILPRSRDLHDPRQVRPVVLLDQRDMVERLEIELRRLAFRCGRRC